MQAHTLAGNVNLVSHANGLRVASYAFGEGAPAWIVCGFEMGHCEVDGVREHN